MATSPSQAPAAEIRVLPDLMRKLEDAQQAKSKARVAAAPQVLVKSDVAAKWYELDRLVRVRDPLLALGFCSVVAGIFMIYRPAALIVAGVGLMVMSWLLAKAR